jgi:hypothetical protein
VRLRRGQTGWLVTAFSRFSAQELGRYDYAAVGEDVVLEDAQARLYGAELPIALPCPASSAAMP